MGNVLKDNGGWITLRFPFGKCQGSQKLKHCILEVGEESKGTLVRWFPVSRLDVGTCFILTYTQGISRLTWTMSKVMLAFCLCLDGWKHYLDAPGRNDVT